MKCVTRDSSKPTVVALGEIWPWLIVPCDVASVGGLRVDIPW